MLRQSRPAQCCWILREWSVERSRPIRPRILPPAQTCVHRVQIAMRTIIMSPVCQPTLGGICFILVLTNRFTEKRTPNGVELNGYCVANRNWLANCPIRVAFTAVLNVSILVCSCCPFAGSHYFVLMKGLEVSERFWSLVVSKKCHYALSSLFASEIYVVFDCVHSMRICWRSVVTSRCVYIGQYIIYVFYLQYKWTEYGRCHCVINS